MISINLFFSKMPHSIEDVMPSSGKSVTCLNTYSYILAQKSDIEYKQFDYITSDGFLIVLLYNIINKNSNKTLRISFDMTSLAPLIFKYAINNKMSIYILGAKEYQIQQFISIVKLSFPELTIIGYRNGYLGSDTERKQILKQIIDLSPHIIIIGMGTPLQDKVSLELREMGFNGTLYTCGGFIHQTQNTITNYPMIINKLNLRFLYRLFTEKGMYKRYYSIILFLLYYLQYVFRLLVR